MLARRAGVGWRWWRPWPPGRAGGGAAGGLRPGSTCGTPDPLPRGGRGARVPGLYLRSSCALESPAMPRAGLAVPLGPVMCRRNAVTEAQRPPLPVTRPDTAGLSEARRTHMICGYRGWLRRLGFRTVSSTSASQRNHARPLLLSPRSRPSFRHHVGRCSPAEGGLLPGGHDDTGAAGPAGRLISACWL